MKKPRVLGDTRPKILNFHSPDQRLGTSPADTVHHQLENDVDVKYPVNMIGKGYQI